MKVLKYLALVFAVLQLQACVAVHPTVAPTAKPAANSGYIAGSFTTNKGTGFGFGIVNTQSGQDYVMPFGEDTLWMTARQDQFGMIQLPPGTYKLSYWVTYATLTKEQMARKEFSNPVVSAPFTVAPGSVVYLGSFSANTEHSYNRIYWSIKPNKISQKEAKEGLDKAYPGFAGLPLSCILCLD